MDIKVTLNYPKCEKDMKHLSVLQAKAWVKVLREALSPEEFNAMVLESKQKKP